MEQPTVEVQSQDAGVPVSGDPSGRTVSFARPPGREISPQACPTCGTAPNPDGRSWGSSSWVYALGNVGVRFPNISVEKELAQVTGREKTTGLTDRQALHTVLNKPENRYLVRQLCWVVAIEGLDTYLLRPRDPVDYGLLVDAIRPTPSPMDLDVVIGMKGPIASSEMCNGLTIPIVIFDQIYSFDREALIKAIPKPEKASLKEFAPAAEELFDRVVQMTDNGGTTDEHRALNYLAVRYHAIYSKAAEEFAANASPSSVDVRSSPLSGTRKISDVIFCYTNRNTDVTEKFFVRVDVTDEFPFLVTKMSPYYDC